jgi:hypothetical protein
MMLFLALLFIFSSTYTLIKGKLFYDVILESVNADIKKARGEIKEISKETAGKLLFVGLYLMVYSLVQIIFLIKSLNLDPYIFPTLSIIIFIFLNYVFSLTRKSKDLTTEEGRAKYLVKHSRRYTFYGTIHKLIFIAYFGYMFGVLIKLIK